MALDFTVISIGALAVNRLWGESRAVRTSHATITLVTADDRAILVDPSLPGPALEARYFERTGKALSSVTDVFLTTLRPAHRRGLAALGHARWWCHETELEAYRDHLKGLMESAERLGSEDLKVVGEDLELVKRFEPAGEALARGVSLYPLAGPSVGSAGLLLTPATMTVVIAGDAALTSEHVRRGQVWEGSVDTEAALRTLEDLLELADVIVPGHDNVMISPQRQWF